MSLTTTPEIISLTTTPEDLSLTTTSEKISLTITPEKGSLTSSPEITPTKPAPKAPVTPTKSTIATATAPASVSAIKPLNLADVQSFLHTFLRSEYVYPFVQPPNPTRWTALAKSIETPVLRDLPGYQDLLSFRHILVKQYRLRNAPICYFEFLVCNWADKQRFHPRWVVFERQGDLEGWAQEVQKQRVLVDALFPLQPSGGGVGTWNQVRMGREARMWWERGSAELLKCQEAERGWEITINPMPRKTMEIGTEPKTAQVGREKGKSIGQPEQMVHDTVVEKLAPSSMARQERYEPLGPLCHCGIRHNFDINRKIASAEDIDMEMGAPPILDRNTEYDMGPEMLLGHCLRCERSLQFSIETVLEIEQRYDQTIESYAQGRKDGRTP